MAGALPYLKSLITHDELGSTSDLARALVVAGETPLPFGVRALRQTQGRGRGTNTWWSDAGSLTVTLAIDPAIHGLSTAHEPRLALATAVALIEAVESLIAPRIPLGIRWPNDVEAGGRKLAGVLPERVEMSVNTAVLVGIGLNVHTNLLDAPVAVRAIATSLHELIDGPLPSIDLILTALLDRLPLVLDELAAGSPSLALEWSRRDQLRDTTVRINQAGTILRGKARGIDEEGALIVDTAAGLEAIHGGQVLRD